MGFCGIYLFGSGVMGGDESRRDVELEVDAGCVLSARALARSVASRRLDIRYPREKESSDGIE